MSATEIIGVVLTGVGALFFTAGTIGLIRFPDIRSRLHALTKADNLGLGLVLAGVAVLLDSPTAAVLLGLTWLLALLAASVSARILGSIEHHEHITEPDQSPTRPGTGRQQAPPTGVGQDRPDHHAPDQHSPDRHSPHPYVPHQYGTTPQKPTRHGETNG